MKRAKKSPKRRKRGLACRKKLFTFISPSGRCFEVLGVAVRGKGIVAY